MIYLFFLACVVSVVVSLSLFVSLPIVPISFDSQKKEFFENHFQKQPFHLSTIFQLFLVLVNGYHCFPIFSLKMSSWVIEEGICFQALIFPTPVCLLVLLCLPKEKHMTINNIKKLFYLLRQKR